MDGTLHYTLTMSIYVIGMLNQDKASTRFEIVSDFSTRLLKSLLSSYDCKDFIMKEGICEAHLSLVILNT